jgi:transcriptional regulator
MYNLPHYKEHDPQVILDFIRHHPFAMLIGCDRNRPVATQVPFIAEERNGTLYLLGHIMKKQDHQLAFEQNPEALVVFTGPHTYVSATWYADPHQASTWNYMSVHLRGVLRFLDEEGLRSVLQKLTLHFENNNQHSSTVFHNLPEEYNNRLMKSIIAFEIETREIDHVFKLSQNRDEQSFHQIIDQLSSREADAKIIAGEMKKRSKKLFQDK